MIATAELPKLKKPKNNKWLYGWKLFVNYGHGDGWEYEHFDLTFKEMRVNRKAYRENCPYPQKWSYGREENPDYIAPVQNAVEVPLGHS